MEARRWIANPALGNSSSMIFNQTDVDCNSTQTLWSQTPPESRLRLTLKENSSSALPRHKRCRSFQNPLMACGISRRLALAFQKTDSAIPSVREWGVASYVPVPLIAPEVGRRLLIATHRHDSLSCI